MQAAAAEESVIWEGASSQWLNLKTYVLSALAGLLIVAALVWAQTSLPPDQRGIGSLILGLALLVPLAVALRSYLLLRFRWYTLTTERVRIATGIFTRRTDELELYRVDDTEMVEPFFLRLIRRGNIILVTSDPSSPNLVIEAVPDVARLRDRLRHYREVCRDRKRTQVVDFVQQQPT